MIPDQHEQTYREVQHFRQWWIWAGDILWSVLVLAVLGYGMVKQLALGQAWGDSPMTDAQLAVVGSAGILLVVALSCSLYATRLVTEVRSDGLHVRFFPFRTKRIPFGDIKRCAARTYRPIMEYGGWGIHWGPGGWAYNVSGNRGVQLVLTRGKRLLIGSQRADELAQAILAGMEQGDRQ